MQIGIGLPAVIPGTPGELVLEWARMADQGPFSSLALIDRVVYPNYEPMLTLAAAAGATRRVRLLTSVLLAPLRKTAILAKEAASLDVLSGGRLTLGLGIGGRGDDFEVCGVDIHTRGKRFAEQLALMYRIWAGEPVSDTVGPIGPTPVQPGGPPILIGGYAAESLRRLARWGAGYIAGGTPPQMAQQAYAQVERVWAGAGRAGKPYFACGTYFALGPDAAERGAAYIRDYYGFLGPMGETMAGALPSTPEAMRSLIKAYEDVGADELLLWPTVAQLDQLDRVAELVS
jgi:alkanesulfonate monooxygenase SsuD/methylene tetrahydromethanopterin reductase-like flavin-dependent oxidoreductase (luciferase family)